MTGFVDKRRFGAALLIICCLGLLLAALPGTARSNTVLFSDNFEDGAADGWSTNGGSWSVVNDGTNVYRQTSTSGNAKAFAGSTAWTDQVVEARVKVLSFVGSSEYVAILARVQNSTNFYYMTLRDANKVEIKKMVAGSPKLLAQADFTVSTDTWYTLRLEVQGSTLRAYVNGVQELSISDAQFAGGRIGLATYNGSAVFDDVLVSSAGGSTPTSTPIAVPPTATSTPVSATPTPTPSGPTPTPAPVGDGPVGFAAVNALGRNGTTGGAGGPAVTVTSAAQFLDYVGRSGPYVIYVDGTINLSGMNRVTSHKSIIGVGTSGRISGGGLTMSGVENIIIRNLSFTGASDDSINIESGSHHIWVDHNDFSNGYDGLVDVKRGSDYITVSWNHFHTHDKTMLLGHSDDNAAQDVGHLRVTYHHNFFNGTGTRHPRVRFGDPVHVFNNYYLNNGYGVASTMDAGVVVEGNYFENVPDTTLVGYAGSDPGRVVARNNVLLNSGAPQTAGSVTEPGTYYSYTLDDANQIPSIVTNGAGVGKVQ